MWEYNNSVTGYNKMTFRNFTFLIVYTLLLFKLSGQASLSWVEVFVPLWIGFAFEILGVLAVRWLKRRGQ